MPDRLEAGREARKPSDKPKPYRRGSRAGTGGRGVSPRGSRDAARCACLLGTVSAVSGWETTRTDAVHVDETDELWLSGTVAELRRREVWQLELVRRLIACVERQSRTKGWQWPDPRPRRRGAVAEAVHSLRALRVV